MEMMSHSVINSRVLPAHDHKLVLYSKRELNGGPGVIGRHEANSRERKRGALMSGMRRAGTWLSHGLVANHP
jgi:hypothetical protein